MVKGEGTTALPMGMTMQRWKTRWIQPWAAIESAMMKPDEGNSDLPVSMQWWRTRWMEPWAASGEGAGTFYLDPCAAVYDWCHGRNTGGGSCQRQSPQPSDDCGADGCGAAGQYLGAFWAALVFRGVYSDAIFLAKPTWCVYSNITAVSPNVEDRMIIPTFTITLIFIEIWAGEFFRQLYPGFPIRNLVCTFSPQDKQILSASKPSIITSSMLTKHTLTKRDWRNINIYNYKF